MDLFKKSVILIELDAILDTRLTIYKKMGIDIDSIMKQGYNNRVYDRFPGVDYDKYMEMYKNRGNELLEAATITDLPYLIVKEAEDDYAFRDAANLINVNEVWINIYPYDLDERETDLIVAGLIGSFGLEDLDVQTICLKYSDAGPEIMKAYNVVMMIMYHGVDWIKSI